MARYLAQSHITHDGAEYRTGAELDLAEAEAAPLLGLGRIAPVPDSSSAERGAASADDASKPRARRPKSSEGAD